MSNRPVSESQYNRVRDEYIAECAAERPRGISQLASKQMEESATLGERFRFDCRSAALYAALQYNAARPGSVESVLEAAMTFADYLSGERKSGDAL